MTAERNSGLRGLLQSGTSYEILQRLLGASSFRSWLVENHWKVESGMTVVDAGCGPARLRKALPEGIQYYGFDPNSDYISMAQQSVKGEFHCGDVTTFMNQYGEELRGRVDIVICSGVLHHLSTEQIDELLRAAKCLLSPTGRFAALEPAFAKGQSWMSRWVVKQDRGTNVLFDHEWESKLLEFFGQADVQVLNGMLRIPYTHALLQGSDTASARGSA